MKVEINILMKLRQLLQILAEAFLSIEIWHSVATLIAVFMLAAGTVFAEPLTFEEREGVYLYPAVFDTLKQGLDALRRIQPDVIRATLKSPPEKFASPNVEACHSTIKDTRRALFCLTYYERNLSADRLNQKGEDFVRPQINTNSVSFLIKEANAMLIQYGIPLPGPDAFKLPEFEGKPR